MLDNSNNTSLILLSTSQFFFLLALHHYLSLSVSFCLYPLILLLFPFIVSSFSFNGEIKDYRAYIFSDGVKSNTCECVSACKLVFAPEACEHTSVCDWFLLCQLPWGNGNPTLAPSLPQVSCVPQRLSSLLLSLFFHYMLLFWFHYMLPGFLTRKPSLAKRFHQTDHAY